MQNVLLGATAVGGIEVIDTMPPIQVGNIDLKLILQVIVSVLTIWKTFRKPKEVKRVDGSYINQTT